MLKALRHRPLLVGTARAVRIYKTYTTTMATVDIPGS